MLLILFILLSKVFSASVSQTSGGNENDKIKSENLITSHATQYLFDEYYKYGDDDEDEEDEEDVFFDRADLGKSLSLSRQGFLNSEEPSYFFEKVSIIQTSSGSTDAAAASSTDSSDCRKSAVSAGSEGSTYSTDEYSDYFVHRNSAFTPEPMNRSYQQDIPDEFNDNNDNDSDYPALEPQISSNSFTFIYHALKKQRDELPALRKFNQNKK